MKLKFSILLPKAILLQFVALGFAKTSTNERGMPSQSENPINAPFIAWPDCYELREFANEISKNGNDFDFLANAHQKFMNKLNYCQLYKRGPIFEEFAAKQIEYANGWIEMPEKLNKTKVEKKKLEEKFENCEKSLAKEMTAGKECSKKLNTLEEEKNPAELWKVLAFVFIGITAALLLFIFGAGAYFYKMGRNKI